MNIKYDWKSVSDKYYFFNLANGRVVGQAGKVALQEIFYCVVYAKQDGAPYSPHIETHLGHYISLEHAKTAVQEYWDIQNRTLIGN